MSRTAPILCAFSLIALIALIAMSMAAASSLLQDRMVHRRTGVPPLVAARVEVTNDGLRVFGVSDGLAQEQVIAWDRVARVDPVRGVYEAGLEERIELGEKLWRGRTRLLRGDARLARGEFQEAWSQLEHEQSETAALAAEGLIRASLARRRQHEAIVPALAVAALKAKGFATDRFAGLRPILDEKTGLIPELPPVLEPTRAVEAAAAVKAWNQGSGDGFQEDTRAALIRALLIREAPERDDHPPNEEVGITFLRRLVELDSTDSKRRERARQLLLRNIDSQPAWREAWIHFFVGRSLVERETDPALRRIGALELLNVPPLGEAAPPELSGRALRLAAQTIRELGDTRNADILDSLAESSEPNDALENSQ
jgi:hypothetical protein